MSCCFSNDLQQKFGVDKHLLQSPPLPSLSLRTHLDVNVNPNSDELADIKYVNKEELKELLRKADAGEGGIKLSPWFGLLVDNFLFKWWDHVEKGSQRSS